MMRKGVWALNTLQADADFVHDLGEPTITHCIRSESGSEQFGPFSHVHYLLIGPSP